MAATDNLPEGTDLIIDDGANAASGASLEPTEAGTTALGNSSDAPPRATSVRESLRSNTDKLKGAASDRAYGFLGQGIERSSGALNNISALVGDTAANLDERLGQEYGDYARTAAGAIERAAASLGAKDPEELFEDARGFVRKSPGIALAGAAILGFALVRVVKSGIESDSPPRKR